jgi:hypothetical protein
MIVANKKLKIVVGMLFLGTSTLINTASAEERVSIHGYGDTAMLRSTDNNYTGRYSGTKWDYNYISLNITAQIDEKTKIVAQLRSGSEVPNDMGAFINHNLTDNLTLRAGQIKAPIGIYNEIRDIKFLQQSVLAPLMYQDAAGTLPDSFKGIEAIYHMDLGAHRLTFDIYGGEPRGANTYVQIAPQNWFLVENVYGVRFTYKTPIGLKFSASHFQNDVLTATTALPTDPAPPPTKVDGSGTRKLSSASAEFRGNNLDIKLEYAIASQLEGYAIAGKGTSYYAQIGYSITEKITPFVRYDYISYNDKEVADPASLIKNNYYQKVKVIGFTYRLNNAVSLRMENHWNTGYAIPAYAQGGAIAINPKEDWNIFAMGANFIF